MKKIGVVRIRAHSSIIYWWVVWLFGYAFAIHTYLTGTPVQFMGSPGAIRTFVVSTDTILGAVFVTLLVRVMALADARRRGLTTLLVFAAQLMFTLGHPVLEKIHPILRFIPEPSAYLSVGAIVAIATSLLVAWLFELVVSWLSYVEIAPGQIIDKRGRRGTVYRAEKAVHIEAVEDDALRSGILGLGFLGFGMGRIVFDLQAPEFLRRPIVLNNVWRPRKKLAEINAILG